MKEPAKTARSQPLRVAWFFTNVFYWMGWLAAVLFVALMVWISVADCSVRYVRLPVEVILLEDSDGHIISPITTGRSVAVAGFSRGKAFILMIVYAALNLGLRLVPALLGRSFNIA